MVVLSAASARTARILASPLAGFDEVFMTSPPLRGLGAASRVDLVLARLHADLVAARAVVQVNRHAPRVNVRRSAADADLLECLEAYAAALNRYRFPVPGRVRDELRLRRMLALEKRSD